MINKLIGMVSPLPLGNVGRNRDYCSLQLNYEPVCFRSWKVFCCPVTLNHQIHGFLPDLKVAVTLEWHITFGKPTPTTDHRPLITDRQFNHEPRTARVVGGGVTRPPCSLIILA